MNNKLINSISWPVIVITAILCGFFSIRSCMINQKETEIYRRDNPNLLSEYKLDIEYADDSQRDYGTVTIKSSSVPICSFYPTDRCIVCKVYDIDNNGCYTTVACNVKSFSLKANEE